MISDARKTARFDWHLQVLSQTLAGLRHKRVIEVGCGLCRFLLMAEAEGADVAGCDLSPEACAFARGHLGITVHQQTLSECRASIGPADAIVMRNLIEHLTDPLGDIETAHAMLKRGGCLLLHTPNGGEAGNDAATAREWVGFRVDFDHLQYLSAQTINWLSEKFGFAIERLEASGFPVLRRIERLPNRKSRVLSLPRDVARRVPGMRSAIRTLRGIGEEVAGRRCDPHLGFYHLFTILRKV